MEAPRSMCRPVHGLALSLALALPAAAAGQTPGRATTAFGLAAGVSDFHQRDEYLAPATYGGTLLAGSALFERRSDRALLRFDAAASIGRIDSDALPRDVHQYVARLSVTLLRALGAPRAPGRGPQLLAGGALSAFGAMTDFKVADPSYGTTYHDVSWDWLRSLDLVLRAEQGSDTRRIAVQLAVPALRWVSRPPSGKDFDVEHRTWGRALLGGRLEFPWDRAVVFGEVEYRQRVGDRVQLRVGYDFAYASSDRPLPLGMYVNMLQVGLLWPR